MARLRIPFDLTWSERLWLFLAIVFVLMLVGSIVEAVR
jgi:hypothetical protein